MTVDVLTAVTGSPWEEELVRAFDGGAHGVRGVRRCVDLADLLATAATGTARAVVLSADLRRLDRDALTWLAVSGVAVVGLVPPGDEQAADRLRRLGVVHVLDASASPERVGALVRTAAANGHPPAVPAKHAGQQAPEQQDEEPGGRIVAVWGPTGAPGRTAVATTLAAEIAGLGARALLVDADPYGGAVAQVFGLFDEAPGLAAAARLANNGTLDLPGLAHLARTVAPNLVVLTGISRADRWPELRPAAIGAALEVARGLATTVLVDCGFCLEQDEEPAFDQPRRRRNGGTLAALQAADTVVAVGSADPVSLARLVRGLADLRDLAQDVLVVVNRLRPGVGTAAEVDAGLQRYAGTRPVAYVPLDVAGLDAALRAGATLAEAAPGSPVRAALRPLAAHLAGLPAPPPKRRRLPFRRSAG